MLNIPIRIERFLGQHRWFPHHKFHENAALIFDMAVEGFMDSSTIQAFLNVWGYAEDQDVNDPQVHVQRVDTAEMDLDTLATIVNDERALERIALGVLPTPEIPYEPSEEDVTKLMRMGWTRESVTHALIRMRGLLQPAITILLEQSNTASPSTQRSIQRSPPGSWPDHSYDDIDLTLVASISNRSYNTAVLAMAEAGGEVELAKDIVSQYSASHSNSPPSPPSPDTQPSSRHSVNNQGSSTSGSSPSQPGGQTRTRISSSSSALDISQEELNAHLEIYQWSEDQFRAEMAKHHGDGKALFEEVKIRLARNTEAAGVAENSGGIGASQVQEQQRRVEDTEDEALTASKVLKLKIRLILAKDSKPIQKLTPAEEFDEDPEALFASDAEDLVNPEETPRKLGADDK